MKPRFTSPSPTIRPKNLPRIPSKSELKNHYLADECEDSICVISLYFISLQCISKNMGTFQSNSWGDL